MPQVRNGRDKIRRELTQADGLLDNVQAYVESTLGDLVSSQEAYDKLTDEQKTFYPPDHEELLMRKQEITALILDGIESLHESIRYLRDVI